MMKPFQLLMQRKRIKFFLPYIRPGDKILEVGSGTGWFKRAIPDSMHHSYQCIDLNAPADIIGDIVQWKSIGLKVESFDVIVAIEVVEHVNCFQACYDLLKPGGRMLITTPVPHFDWALKVLENIGLNQKRTSPHSNLVYLDKVPFAGEKRVHRVFYLSQWAVFTRR